jgi:hypothetical protein
LAGRDGPEDRRAGGHLQTGCYWTMMDSEPSCLQRTFGRQMILVADLVLD